MASAEREGPVRQAKANNEEKTMRRMDGLSAFMLEQERTGAHLPVPGSPTDCLIQICFRLVEVAALSPCGKRSNNVAEVRLTILDCELSGHHTYPSV
jgi:hypothetical protein